MKEHERKRLLERLDRDGATVGRQVPERVEVDGEPFELRSFLFEVKRLDGVPPEERERVQALKRALRRERLERRQTIEDGAVSVEEGEALAEAVLGIDRALNALDSLEPTDLEAEARASEAADRKRWITFLNRALGKEGGRRSRP